MNCAHCNKPFTCGCQKTQVDWVTIHKTCRTSFAANKAEVIAKANEEKVKASSRDFDLQLASHQIKNLRNT